MDRYHALQHAVRAHGDVTDWGGRLYVLHPMEVADRVERHWPDLEKAGPPWGLLPGGISFESGVVVALLHDVLEDTDYDLPKHDLTRAQRWALMLVTHDPDDTYAEYIERIASDPLATIVKLADLSHNMSAERSEGLTLDQLKRMDSLRGRYAKARQTLWTALGEEWWPV